MSAGGTSVQIRLRLRGSADASHQRQVSVSPVGVEVFGGGASVPLTRLLTGLHAAAAERSPGRQNRRQQQTTLKKDRSTSTRSKTDQSSQPLFVESKVAL